MSTPLPLPRMPLPRLVLAALLCLFTANVFAEDSRTLAASRTTAPASEKKVALVIGNAAYRENPLRNPVNDARAMSAKLKKLGFEVITHENVTALKYGAVLREFRSKLSPGAVALFFYAGHGLQVNGKNYLPAVDAQIQGEEDVPMQSLDLNQVLLTLEDSKTRMNLVFLDACRNNPYARSFRSAAGGLARIDAPSGTLISYATRPGSVAADGTGANGLYTTQLLKHMEVPGQPIEQVLKEVVGGVSDASRGAQEPWMEGSIRGNFYFVPGVAGSNSPANTATPAMDTDRQLWEESKKLNSVASYKAYIERFPNGAYAGLARTSLQGFADKGDAGAQYLMGRIYEAGIGVTHDFATAVSWYRKSAAQGAPPPQHRLAVALQNGNGVARNPSEAMIWLRKSAESGYADAQYDLAASYATGTSVEKDIMQAELWFQKAADQGHIPALRELAQHHFNNRNSEKATELARRAITQGDVQMEYMLGAILVAGKMAAKNEREGLALLRSAASKGYAPAQSAMGTVYQQGIAGIGKDTSQAISWYRKAADQGNAEAQYKLGEIYFYGDGVAKDSSHAVAWIRKSADQQFALAQLALASMYMNGSGVSKDERQAVALLEAAANQGLADAQFAFGTLYEQGIGVTKNRSEARRWFEKAAAQGHTEAGKKL